MSEVNGTPVEAFEAEMQRIRQEATRLITRIDQTLLNAIHEVINREPGHVAAACLAAALADVMAEVSKTEDGCKKNVLIVSEMIERIAVSGMKEKVNAAPSAARLRLHH